MTANEWSKMTNGEKHYYLSGQKIEIEKKTGGVNIGEYTHPFYRAECADIVVSDWVVNKDMALIEGEKYIASLKQNDWPDYFGIAS